MTFARWREHALEDREATLVDKDSRNPREDLLARQLAEAERTIEQLVLENDPLGQASRQST